MPRRQYNTDLQTAIQGIKPEGIHDIKAGEDDGQFEFLFTLPSDSQSSKPVKVTAMVPELSDYPKNHEYMIFGGDDAPPQIGAALENVSGTNRKTVSELLEMVASALGQACDGDTYMADSFVDDSEPEDDDEDDVYADDHLDDHGNVLTTLDGQSSTRNTSKSNAFCQAIREDLRIAKASGFKVGYQGQLLQGNTCYVSISIRMSKLRLTEEVCQAWQIDPSEYLVLIIQYPNGYRTNEDLQTLESAFVRSNIGMRVCAGKRYKPTLREAISAFTVAKKVDSDSLKSNQLPEAIEVGLGDKMHDIFISKPLADLLEERLVEILRYRSSHLSWRGAEDFFNYQHAKAGGGGQHGENIPDEYFRPEDIKTDLPAIVMGDHFAESGQLFKHSFPLLAMQFTLRHFVRCTEFCLVCHRKLDEEVEAIKPYVCDSHLCLFQYMAMGFGPSIEHEIMAQPYVVDLLVSFCYAGASARRLKDLPIGLALVVPFLKGGRYDPFSGPVDAYGMPLHNASNTSSPQPSTAEELPTYTVQYNSGSRELTFSKRPSGGCPVKRGQWIVMSLKDDKEARELHCRVRNTNLYPTIQIDEPIVVQCKGTHPTYLGQKAPATTAQDADKATKSTPAESQGWREAKIRVYAQDFEKLNEADQQTAMCQLLDTLPSVKETQTFLAKSYPPNLAKWVERISPSALSLLRWIIASNRACIMEVDGDQGLLERPKQQERVFGMKGYMQFRFAMGAPDKEQRFREEVRKVSERKDLKFSTIFAWHGSPLMNWHSIVRSGLHFDRVDHGRAYGDGVYFAKDANTSTGYSGGHRGGTSGMPWPNSVLKVTSALALNEIVNAPDEFQSSNPFYVVKQCEWIQQRYLFVSMDQSSVTKAGDERQPIREHPQDPSRTPSGLSGHKIIIPASAIKTITKTGKQKQPDDVHASKKLKGKGGFDDPVVLDSDDAVEDDGASVATEAEDIDILLSDDEVANRDATAGASQDLTLRHKSPKKGRKAAARTDFVPGSLDHSTLPIMPVPTYANSSTTRRLMKELQHLAKIQNSTAPEDLGWYIDVDKMENAYQWIVELHSFHTLSLPGSSTKNPKPLPLVQQMKDKRITSVVLEIRFGADYPFSPPYIRVIRPRFLSFAQGGGGHIVMGGAMCMELLTNTGWSSVSSMESVLLQVRLAIASDPPAKLDVRASGDYGTGEAADGYVRACQTHGWKVPPGFQEVANGMQPESATGKK